MFSIIHRKLKFRSQSFNKKFVVFLKPCRMVSVENPHFKPTHAIIDETHAMMVDGLHVAHKPTMKSYC